ncbi:hypothetical protein RIF29_10795 [Crotalaria pallida]|uniref:Uncharacterized protein n=1 Tax=Crotalaria pallida TaxID=3830 RepID=A0AAN9FZA6_CROPI
MAKKRGRPAKSTPSTANHDKEQKQSISESIPLDFETLDDLDLDSLTPKQAEKVLTALDSIRSRIVAKATDGSDSQKEDGNSKEKQTPSCDSHLAEKADLALIVRTPGSGNQQKLQALKGPLAKLNKECFAKIDQKEIELKEKLDSIQAQLRVNPTDVVLKRAERDVSVQYSKVVWKEKGVS